MCERFVEEKIEEKINTTNIIFHLITSLLNRGRQNDKQLKTGANQVFHSRGI